MISIREFKCPYCNMTIDTYRDEWTPFNCPGCKTQLSMETVLNHYNKLAIEYDFKVQKISSITNPSSIDEQLQYTLKQLFEADKGLIGVWKYAGMPIKLSEIIDNLDFKVGIPDLLELIPGPKLQAKKSTAQLLLYFFITYKGISTINKELFKIIYDRVNNENDYVTLNFYFNCLSEYEMKKLDAFQLLKMTIDRLGTKFFDNADVFHFANTKFPELNLMDFTINMNFGLLSKEERLQIIEKRLQDIKL